MATTISAINITLLSFMEKGLVAFTLIPFIPVELCYLMIEIWFLKKKKRSLYFLFLHLFSGLGLIILLTLETKSSIEETNAGL